MFIITGGSHDGVRWPLNIELLVFFILPAPGTLFLVLCLLLHDACQSI